MRAIREGGHAEGESSQLALLTNLKLVSARCACWALLLGCYDAPERLRRSTISRST
jgi:hypothetical protein